MHNALWVNDILVISGVEQLARVEKRRDSQTLVVTYPVVDGDIPVVEQVLQRLHDDEAPWDWHLLFDLSAFEGYETFAQLESFASGWRHLLAGNGDGRRIAVASADPLIAARFRTGCYQTLFRGHDCALFETPAEAARWIASN